MSEFEKALQYVRDNWDTDNDFFPSIENITEVSDLMEEYGADNDLPEGWWMEYGEPEDILARLDQEARKDNQ